MCVSLIAYLKLCPYGSLYTVQNNLHSSLKITEQKKLIEMWDAYSVMRYDGSGC